ncbi:hypothetical protein [Geomonas ferrireducens]|uniref:hypothetical protein n=1 Tax=Geomonas ferrireducens TaxID=2570227 RepID=UPI0010A7F0B3|nr:hypothetical protein [Geomonas ferrireducens]
MPLKSISTLLLVVLFCFILGGTCESAHAKQLGVSAASCDQTVSHEGAECDLPGCPADGESGHTDCDFCCDCACHLSLSLGSFSFNYLPLLSDIKSFDRFTFLPEVFLSKFVPPQLRA